MPWRRIGVTCEVGRGRRGGWVRWKEGWRARGRVGQGKPASGLWSCSCEYSAWSWPLQPATFHPTTISLRRRCRWVRCEYPRNGWYSLQINLHASPWSGKGRAGRNMRRPRIENQPSIPPQIILLLPQGFAVCWPRFDKGPPPHLPAPA